MVYSYIMNNNDRIFKMPFVDVYPAYIKKAEKKGRTKEEVDELAKGKVMEKILRK